MDEVMRSEREQALKKIYDFPFAPLRGGNDAVRSSHALEYIAAQLWEIRAMMTKLIQQEKG
jgi:hypothetical protein